MGPCGMNDGRRPGATAGDQGRRCPRHDRASRQRDGRAVWSAGRPGAQGGPVDQLLGAGVEGAGLQQVEVEVAGTREDRLVPVWAAITGNTVTWIRSTRPAAI